MEWAEGKTNRSRKFKNQLGDWARNGGGVDNDGTIRGSNTVRGGQIQLVFWKVSQHDLLKIISKEPRRKEELKMIAPFVA